MENLCKRGCLSPPEVCHIPLVGWRWGRLVPLCARLQGAGAGEVLSLLQQWYTSSMNVVCTWLTDRMDLQLHIYQLKTLIRIVKVTAAVLSWASCCWKGRACVCAVCSDGTKCSPSFTCLKMKKCIRWISRNLKCTCMQNMRGSKLRVTACMRRGEIVLFSPMCTKSTLKPLLSGAHMG